MNETPGGVEGASNGLVFHLEASNQTRKIPQPQFTPGDQNLEPVLYGWSHLGFYEREPRVQQKKSEVAMFVPVEGTYLVNPPDVAIAGVVHFGGLKGPTYYAVPTLTSEELANMPDAEKEAQQLLEVALKRVNGEKKFKFIEGDDSTRARIFDAVVIRQRIFMEQFLQKKEDSVPSAK